MEALTRLGTFARTLVAAPVPSALAVVALALGVGANAAVFSAVRGVLLSPLPYPQADQIVRVWTEHSVSPELFGLLEERLASVVSLDASRTVALSLLGDGEAWEVPGGSVTGAHFAMLRAVPALGRVLDRADQAPGAEPVVVLSHGLWKSRFGGDPSVLGQKVPLGDADGPSRIVVGVMPSGHRPLGSSWQAWVPVRLDPADEESWSHSYGLRLHARLGEGRGTQEASAELRAVASRLAAEHPKLFLRNHESAAVARLLEVTVGDVRGQLLLLSGAVALVLLVACANVANLLLTRGVRRRRELAIRAALGATRGRLARQLLGESALLGLTGGAAGVLLAHWLVGLLGALPVELPRAEAIRVDALVLTFALGLGLASSLLAGLLPALRTGSAHLQEALAEGGRTGTGSLGRRLQGGLVTVEVALAVVLVVGAGLLLRSASRLRHVDPGFQYESVWALHLSPPPSRYPTGTDLTAYYERLLERLSHVPGVRAAGAATLLPLAGGRMGVAFEIDGVPPPAGEPAPRADYNPVSGDFFKALGVPLVAGRWLEAADGRAQRPAPVLVNRAFAEEFFPDTDPIGHRLTGDGEEWMRIVGVVGNVRQSQLDAEPRPAIYPPHGQDPQRRLYLAVRTDGTAAARAAAVGAAVSELDPLVPVARFSPMSDVVSGSLSRDGLFAGLLAGFAALALALGGVGVYGVVSYGVSQRTREIGVRMALGANRHVVLLEVLRSGLQPVAVGLLAGLALAAAGGQLVAGYLYGVPSHDPLTLGVVGVGVLLVGVAASLGPARRAAGLDPIAALRAE